MISISYRPISNLRFVSYATEKVVATRLNEHVNNGDLIELFQSAYEGLPGVLGNKEAGE